MSLTKRTYHIFADIYPEITDYLEEKIEDPQWLSELNERLDALAEAYGNGQLSYAFPSL